MFGEGVGETCEGHETPDPEGDAQGTEDHFFRNFFFEHPLANSATCFEGLEEAEDHEAVEEYDLLLGDPCFDMFPY